MDHEQIPKITAVKDLATKTCLRIHRKPSGFDYMVQRIIHQSILGKFSFCLSSTLRHKLISQLRVHSVKSGKDLDIKDEKHRGSGSHLAPCSTRRTSPEHQQKQIPQASTESTEFSTEPVSFTVGQFPQRNKSQSDSTEGRAV